MFMINGQLTAPELENLALQIAPPFISRGSARPRAPARHARLTPARAPNCTQDVAGKVGGVHFQNALSPILAAAPCAYNRIPFPFQNFFAGEKDHRLVIHRQNEATAVSISPTSSSSFLGSCSTAAWAQSWQPNARPPRPNLTGQVLA